MIDMILRHNVDSNLTTLMKIIEGYINGSIFMTAREAYTDTDTIEITLCGNEKFGGSF